MSEFLILHYNILTHWYKCYEDVPVHLATCKQVDIFPYLKPITNAMKSQGSHVVSQESSLSNT